jgi:hypothetical protein
MKKVARRTALHHTSEHRNLQVIYSALATCSNEKKNKVGHDMLLLGYRGKTAKNCDELYILG